eukprot:CAMPEP_0116117558 /NCGR_PEP_ID=MMETSP0329-20121206/1635_1 /TAXON_ID=697910 /ORGANISM="Pseudo-nitzschia arenysensis, Strain B593" /LENGTH=250 /DNA_ID=CAMNT_0003611127 /DNA_START=424 /DNA_END=1173 /DNA_ORIENTATION=+
MSSSADTNHEFQCVHLDKDWCPGTIMLREVARDVALENNCRKYSKKIAKQILKRMDGKHFYRCIKGHTDSDDSSDCSSGDSSDENDSVGEYGFGCYTKDDDVDANDEDDVEEICRSELYNAIRPFYIGEWFMVETDAEWRDVYFKHPNHPGTQAFVRASQQLVIRLGTTANHYDDDTNEEMRKLLYDSRFFSGRAPRCFEADEEMCDRIFRARYEFDLKTTKRITSLNRERRPVPGTLCFKCSCLKRKTS